MLLGKLYGVLEVLKESVAGSIEMKCEFTGEVMTSRDDFVVVSNDYIAKSNSEWLNKIFK